MNDNESKDTNSSRRFFLTTGATLAGTALLSSGDPLRIFEPAQSLAEVTPSEKLGTFLRLRQKRVYLPPLGARDAASHSRADSLFWSDIMMEHAMFFVMLLPGDDLKSYRIQAQNFQVRFTRLFNTLLRTRVTSGNFRGLNRQTIAHVQAFHDYKMKMLNLQLTGKISTLVWPLFWDHTAREAQRFMERLKLYNTDTVVFEKDEIVSFWTSTMGEHAQFISHLLDPQEEQLIQKADETADLFLNTLRGPSASIQMLRQAGEEIINFKVAAEKGIATGKIKSIIHPALADHVRREAVKYVDELKRVDS